MAITTSHAHRTTDPTAIAKLTIASSLAGATFTALYESTIGRAKAIRELEAISGAPSSSNGGTNVKDAIARYRHRTPLLAASAALNSGIVAFSFFNAREHLISPALSEFRSRRGSGIDMPTWNGMRTQNVLDTAVTGALLGGGLNAWKRGIAGIPSGAVTAALACTAIQLLSNEFRVQRVRFIASKQRGSSFSDSSSSISIPIEAQPEEVVSPFPMATQPGTDVAEASSARLSDVDSPSFAERALSFIGISRVDDTEYLRRLKAKREIHLARIRELETQIEAGKTG